MAKQQFDATAELKTMREIKSIASKRRYRKSRLNQYRAELVALKKAGASYRDLAFWLRKKHYVKISHTSIMRYLKKLPELQEE